MRARLRHNSQAIRWGNERTENHGRRNTKRDTRGLAHIYGALVRRHSAANRRAGKDASQFAAVVQHETWQAIGSARIRRMPRAPACHANYSIVTGDASGDGARDEPRLSQN